MVEKSPFPHAGLPSSQFRLTAEPPLVQKRKLDEHKMKRTYITENPDTESDLPVNKALLYKAGYRRVEFTTPTEYRLHYGPPLLKGPGGTSPLIQAAAESSKVKNHKNGQKAESKRPETNGKERKTCKHRHIINGAPVNGRSHTIIREPVELDRPTVNGGQDGGSSKVKEHVHNMQKKFEERMGKEDNGKACSHYPPGNPCKQLQKHRRKELEHHVQTRDSKSCSSAKEKLHSKPQQRKKRNEKNKENEHQPGATHIKEEEAKGHRRSSTYPLVTEYQCNFNRAYSADEKATLKKQFAESGQGIGFKDHVRDLIYFCPATVPSRGPIEPPPLRIPESPPPFSYSPPVQCDTAAATTTTSVNNKVITPQTYTVAWDTEYTTNFVSPVQLSYADGAWHGAPHHDNRIHPSSTSVKDNPLLSQHKRGVADYSSHPAVSSWFEQVLELRKKAQEFKHRAEKGSVPPDYLQTLCQEEEDEEVLLERPISSSTPTISVSSLSQEESSQLSIARRMSLHRPSVEGGEEGTDIECSNLSNCGSCHGRRGDPTMRDKQHSTDSQAQGDDNVCTCTVDLSHPAHVEQDLGNTQQSCVTKQPGTGPSLGGPRTKTVPVRRTVVTTPQSSIHPPMRRRAATSLYPAAPTKHKPVDASPVNPPAAPVLVYSKSKPTITGFPKPSRSPVKLIPPKTTSHSPVSHPPPSSLPHPTLPVSQHPHTIPRSNTCQTCGTCCPAPSQHIATTDECKICRYSYDQSTNPLPTLYKAPPTSSVHRPVSTASPLLRSSVPICPPSCPNSLRKDDSFSLSSVSISSSCSVASDILERARHRQQNFWSSKTKN